MLFAIGMLVCATYAAPANSEIQEENDQKKLKELLDLIDRAANSQQEESNLINKEQAMDEYENKQDLAESELMSVKKALELLKEIAKLQEDNDDDDDDDGNALTEIEQFSLDNKGDVTKEEEVGEDEFKDDAKVQRRKSWRQRGHRRGRGRRYRRRRCKGGTGNQIAGHFGNLFGGILGGLGRSFLGGGGHPLQGNQGYID